MSTGRLEAFSDGVLAIIITVMVLELKIPDEEPYDLNNLIHTSGLGLLTYLLSFVYVGIYWNNHHHLFQLVERVNGTVLWANLHLLLWLSLFPFVTAWAGESHFAAIPMTCYAVVSLMCAISYTILQVVIVRAHESNHRAAEAAGADLKGRISIGAYIVAIIAPFFGEVGVWVAGLCLAGVAAMWFIPDRRIENTVAG